MIESLTHLLRQWMIIYFQLIFGNLHINYENNINNCIIQTDVTFERELSLEK